MTNNSSKNTVVQFPQKNALNNKPYALIIGVNGAIGGALAKAYSTTHQIVGVARDIHEANHNFTLVQTDYSETHFPELLETLKSISESYSVIINCNGFLHNKNIRPAKRLSQISEENLAHYFYVNASLPALLMKHLHPLLPKHEHSVFAHLSAMVGSISDNRYGGWYGYRASKAALNMLIKTASIEMARTHEQTALVAIHPGTTKSLLSAPFTSSTPPEKLYPPELSAKRIKKVISNLDASYTGQFFHWSGNNLNW